MHEMAIAQGILDIVLEAASQNDAATVLCIKLQVGEMTEVEPEALTFCFAALAAGTAAAGARLDVEVTPLVGRCRDCGREFRVEQFRFLCPACGSAGVEIVSGRELRVEHLEVE
ncbi:MAG TPA: hydrogenase maturation nickel metallochaperone HypA [Negativicutes bacterium]|nr:hydrogenase maturation nickel metallochaperone HypA [Negativicutes bacterium]